MSRRLITPPVILRQRSDSSFMSGGTSDTKKNSNFRALAGHLNRKLSVRTGLLMKHLLWELVDNGKDRLTYLETNWITHPHL